MTVLVRMPHVFGPRWTEWLGAGAALFAGIGLLHPTVAFESASFSSFDFAPWAETFWGYFLTIIGSLRFIALIINGRRKRITPWMRLSGALISFLVFLGFSIGLAFSGVVTTWPGAWPVLALMEFVNIVRATSDARINYDRSQ